MFYIFMFLFLIYLFIIIFLLGRFPEQSSLSVFSVFCFCFCFLDKNLAQSSFLLISGTSFSLRQKKNIKMMFANFISENFGDNPDMNKYSYSSIIHFINTDWYMFFVRYNCRFHIKKNYLTKMEYQFDLCLTNSTSIIFL